MAFHAIHHGIEMNFQTLIGKETSTKDILLSNAHLQFNIHVTKSIPSPKKMLFWEQKGSVEHEKGSIKAP